MNCDDTLADRYLRARDEKRTRVPMNGTPELKEGFPAGLRILAVDDDPLCLKIIERMLKRCNYTVTCCSRGSEAIGLLREKRHDFDLVLSDVIMPDINGFRLLEIVGLEIDVPVIMMSANEEVSNVMKGIHHGACDYLLKPVRIEELKNVWQHVIRRRRAAEEGKGDVDEGQGNKKRLKRDEEGAEGNPPKKPRVVWTAQLHQQFVSAVTQLGIDKAVPKRILDLMNVSGLTRENVASHLQKYRLYLKRLSNIQQGAQHGQNPIQMHSHMGGGPLNPYETSPNALNQAHMAQAGVLNANQMVFNNSAMAVGQPSVQGFMAQQPNPQFMNFPQQMVSPSLPDMPNFSLDTVGIPQNKADTATTGSHPKSLTDSRHSIEPLNTQNLDTQGHHANCGGIMSGDLQPAQQQSALYPHLNSTQGMSLNSQQPMLNQMGPCGMSGNQDHSNVFGKVDSKGPVTDGMTVDSTQHGLHVNNSDSVKIEAEDSILLTNSREDDQDQKGITSSENSDILDFILKDVNFSDDMAVLDF